MEYLIISPLSIVESKPVLGPASASYPGSGLRERAREHFENRSRPHQTRIDSETRHAAFTPGEIFKVG